MQPFLGRKWQQWFIFHYEIAIPSFDELPPFLFDIQLILCHLSLDCVGETNIIKLFSKKMVDLMNQFILKFWCLEDQSKVNFPMHCNRCFYQLSVPGVCWLIELFWVGGVWLYLIILVLCSNLLHLTLVRDFTYFPTLVWEKWTKYWTKVVIHGNLVPTKVTPKGIANQQTYANTS